MRGDPIELRLVALPTVLPVFTTTVGQRVIRASESPRSVTVLDREEIDAVAAVSVNQLLRQLPGLQELPSPPSKTSISIRGFDDSRVLVLVDGEPVAGSLVESRDIGRLSTIAAERIEVTKGPSAVEFGSDALGGVINIVQAAPTQALTVDGTARQGGLGRQESSLGVSQRVGRFGYRLNGGWRQTDRLTGYDAASTTFNRIYDVRADLRYALSDEWQLRLNLVGSQERQRFPVDATFNGFIDNRGGQGFAEVQGPLLGGRALCARLPAAVRLPVPPVARAAAHSRVGRFAGAAGAAGAVPARVHAPARAARRGRRAAAFQPHARGTRQGDRRQRGRIGDRTVPP